MTTSLSARLAICAVTCLWAAVGWSGEHSPSFEMSSQFLASPPGMLTIGDSHGDIAVSPNGDIYVSVQGGGRPGIQVYSAQGRYLRNLSNAPQDLHGFVIANTPDGSPFIFGVSLIGQRAIQMTLEGDIVLTIPASSIPDRYKANANGKASVALTGIAVAPNGEIYVVDGYGRDFIHRFARSGQYLSTFGGQEAPWNFSQCHKIAIDPRFKPATLLCTDRLHDRIVRLALDGDVLGVVAQNLRWPSALAIYHDELAVAELGGRVSIINLEGEVVATIGTNERADEVKTNAVPPERWRPNVFYAPHGITYSQNGDLLISEWSTSGRVVRVVRH